MERPKHKRAPDAILAMMTPEDRKKEINRRRVVSIKRACVVEHPNMPGKTVIAGHFRDRKFIRAREFPAYLKWRYDIGLSTRAAERWGASGVWSQNDQGWLFFDRYKVSGVILMSMENIDKVMEQAMIVLPKNFNQKRTVEQYVSYFPRVLRP